MVGAIIRILLRRTEAFLARQRSVTLKAMSVNIHLVTD